MEGAPGHGPRSPNSEEHQRPPRCTRSFGGRHDETRARKLARPKFSSRKARCFKVIECGSAADTRRQNDKLQPKPSAYRSNW